MKIYKLFDGSYLDLDHVVAVSKLYCNESSREFNEHRCFHITLMFVAKPMVVYFPYRDYVHLLEFIHERAFWTTPESKEKVSQWCQEKIDQFIKDWHNKEFLSPISPSLEPDFTC
jgi:hypothetical protein